MIADQQENPETRRKMDKRETEKLNEHVQLREGTWNILTTTYKDRNLREALWKEIAGEMKMVPSEIKNKWNSLRCSFRTTLNKMNSTKSGQGASTKQPPQIFHLLKFLEPTLRLEAPTISNLSEVCMHHLQYTYFVLLYY
ncbi:uncharacterized protein LOC118747692 [Rhagoletis pomonella]|uniref:uncharacterized protein LOC118747692 n=1 Tax=Rhagoletis pomonella TaxID=28610 RepID=UPI00178401B9|nr:uncharacterized protein LOC118747692 [Rhagoletis pomonella]